MNNKRIERWKEANIIYASLLHLSPNEAIETVNQLSSSNEVKDLVIKLINSGEMSNNYIEQKIISINDIITPEVDLFKKGDELDQYELLEEIGQGGMSFIFKARRINIETQKEVAIKVLKSVDKNQQVLNHFFAEQKILSELSHPNIIQMHHGGTTAKGISYLVLELVEGATSIDTYVKDSELSLKEKIALIIKASRAISYTHTNLVIHRDIKPSNILLNNQGELKVVDFGIAKLVNKKVVKDQNTLIALTPYYASPEQVNSENVSTTSDIFSLAVVTLKLINDKNPFSQSRLIKSCSDDEKDINKALRSSQIDKDLKNILNQALKKDPKERYSSMDHFADDLSNWLENRPVSASPDTLVYHFTMFAKRRKALFSALLGLFMTLTLGIIVLSWQYNKTLIEAEKARQVREFMLNTFENTDPDKNLGQKVSANDLLNAAAKRIENDLELDQEIRIELLESIGIAFTKLGLYEQATNYLNKTLDASPHKQKTISYLAENYFNSKNYIDLESLLGSINWDKMTEMNEKFRTLQVQARLQARNMKFDQAFETINSIKELNLTKINDQVQTQRLIAEIYFFQSQPNKSIEIIRNALDEPSLNKNQSLVFNLRRELSQYYIDQSEFEIALKELRSLLLDQTKHFGKEHPELLETLYVMFASLRQSNQLDEAQEVAENAYKINIENFGENSIQVAYALNNLAAIYSHFPEKRVQVLEIQLKSLEIFENEFPKDNSDVLEAKANYVNALYSNKKYDEALTLIIELYDTQYQKLGENHHQTIFSKQLWGNILRRQGKGSEAMKLLKEARIAAIEHLGLKNPHTMGSIYSEGIANQTFGNFQLAKKLYKILVESEHVQNTPLFRQASKRLAQTLVELGEYEEVPELFKNSLRLCDLSFGRSHKYCLDTQASYIDFLILTKRKDEANKHIDDFKSKISDDESRIMQWNNFSNNISLL